MATKKLVIRGKVGITGSMDSGAGDDMLTRDASSFEIGKVPAIDTSNFISTTLPSGQILVGNNLNIATPRTASNAITISNTGVVDITGGYILDAHINAAAGIQKTKIAPGTALYVLRTNAGGTAVEYADPTTIAPPAWLLSSGGTLTGPNTITGTSSNTLTLLNTALVIVEEAASNAANINLRYLDGTDAGAYLWSDGATNGAIFGGANYETAAAVYRAKSTSASGMFLNVGTITFYGNTGLTPGNTFTPTTLFSFGSAGGSIASQGTLTVNGSIFLPAGGAKNLTMSDGVISVVSNTGSPSLDLRILGGSSIYPDGVSIIRTRTDSGITGTGTSGISIGHVLLGAPFTTGATNQLLHSVNASSTFTVNHTGVSIYGFRYAPNVAGSQSPANEYAFYGNRGTFFHGANGANITANTQAEFRSLATNNIALKVRAAGGNTVYYFQVTDGADNVHLGVIGGGVASGVIMPVGSVSILGSSGAPQIIFTGYTMQSQNSTALNINTGGNNVNIGNSATTTSVSGVVSHTSTATNVNAYNLSHTATLAANNLSTWRLSGGTVSLGTVSNYYKISTGATTVTGANNQEIIAFGDFSATYTVNHTGVSLRGFQYAPSIGGSQTPSHVYALQATTGKIGLGNYTNSNITAGDIWMDSGTLYWGFSSTNNRINFSANSGSTAIALNQVVFGVNASQIQSSANLTFNGTTLTTSVLSVTGNATVGGALINARITGTLTNPVTYNMATALAGTATESNVGFLSAGGTYTMRGTGGVGGTHSYLNAGTGITTGSADQVVYGTNIAGSLTVNHTNISFIGHWFHPTFAGTQLASFGAKAWIHESGFVQWASVLTPAQIIADQNDYNPDGWTNGGAPYGASILRVFTDAPRNITSLAGGVEGRLAIVTNVGPNDVVLTHDDGASGTAANRFSLAGNTGITLKENASTMLFYDGTTSRWRTLNLTSSTAMSAITAAVGGNSIDNVANQQIWQWNSITSGALFIHATATTSLNESELLEVNRSGAHAASGITSYSGYFRNVHTGTTSTNVAGYFTASGGTTNYAIEVGSGNIKLASGTDIRDANGNELLKFTQTASAVNEITFVNAAANGAPIIKATGDDSTIGIILEPKGVGGAVLIGLTDALATANEKLQIADTSTTGPTITVSAFLNGVSGSRLKLDHSRGTSVGSFTVVSSGDTLGEIIFRGADGTNFEEGAVIRAEVDGTPGDNDMPGRLVFLTTADGGIAPIERLRITSQGNIGLFGATTFDTGVGVMALLNATTPPAASDPNQVMIYAKDSSDGSTNSTLAIHTEQAVEAIGTFTASHKLKIWINGVEYWIQLDAV